MAYHQMYQLMLRLGLDIEKDARTNEYLFAADRVCALRLECVRVTTLYGRSVKIGEAGKILRKAHSSIALMIRRGELGLDAETDGSGAKFVTSGSVEVRRHCVSCT